MGKKGSWFSAIKRVFIPTSKDKGTEEKNSKAIKGLGKSRHEDKHSFIPLLREPSSVEKILGDAEEHHLINVKLLTNNTKVQLPKALPPTSPSAHANPPRAAAVPPKAATSPRRHRAERTLMDRHACATKIQAVYRGYMARRSYRALKGLVRLQNLMKGQSVKRQIVSALKSMQLLVHVQSQIQSRRIHMLENQAPQRQASCRSSGNWHLNQIDEWDDSVLTKQEVDTRMQRKIEAIVKRERALAYAYSDQLQKATPIASPAAFKEDIQTAGGLPWWSNWVDRRVPSITPSSMASDNILSTKNIHLNARPVSRYNNYKESGPGFVRNFHRPRASSTDSPFKDNDSLTSCPAFSVPRYMEPTTSARAKVRVTSTTDEPKSRFSSSPLAQGIKSFKWSKGSLFGTKEPTPLRQIVKTPSSLSVDSTISMPTIIGRKPFNRYV
ncbi:IQ-DOMAIN 14-like [Dionaea muscipula]